MSLQTVTDRLTTSNSPAEEAISSDPAPKISRPQTHNWRECDVCAFNAVVRGRTALVSVPVHRLNAPTLAGGWCWCGGLSGNMQTSCVPSTSYVVSDCCVNSDHREMGSCSAASARVHLEPPASWLSGFRAIQSPTRSSHTAGLHTTRHTPPQATRRPERTLCRKRNLHTRIGGESCSSGGYTRLLT